MNAKAFRPIHIGLRVATAAVVLALVGTLVAIEVKFGDYLIGNIRTETSAQILTPLDLAKLESAQKQLKSRKETPYAAANIRNPFNPLPTAAPTPP